jgi:hypothetical protein
MHSVGHRCLILGTALALAALSATAVVAQQDPGAQPGTQPEPQPYDQSADDVDPPSQAARLSIIEGVVSVQPAGVDDWSVATINRPLTGGDQLWSDRGSRAQIDLDAATVSLGTDSSVTFLNLGDQAAQLQLSAGTIIVALHDADPGSAFEIDAPSASVSLLRTGSYRIAVDNNGNTTVATRDGQARVITRAGRSVTLRGGQAAQFGASGDVDVAALPAADDFERWSAQHGQRWAADVDSSRYYMASDVVGAQDLDGYGEWVEEPDYGYTWYPTTVAVDWAPYRYGRWLWVAPWGWTWVDNAPWGYAPFHYGRWTYLRQRWGWVPAPPGRRAVYAPALVAWIAGPRDNLRAGSERGGGAPGATGPAVGWLPLAPGEVYLPRYRVSPRYLRNVNVSNTVIINSDYITNVYRNPGLQSRYANRDAPRALSVVSQHSFTSGGPVAARLVTPSPQWQAVDATPRPPGIVPSRQSVLGPPAQSPVRRPPVAIANRPVVASHPAAPASPALSSAQTPPSVPPTPAVRATPGRPTLPDRQVMPVAPIAPMPPTPPMAPAAPTAPAAAPIERRAIPERAPQFRPAAPPEAPTRPLPLPVPSRESAPARQEFERAPLPVSREAASPPIPPAPPSAAAPPPPAPQQSAQPPARGRAPSQGVRPEER